MLTPSPVYSVSSSNTTSGALTAQLGTTTGGDVYWYCSGFDITVGGATAGSILAATLAGCQGGTITLMLASPSGVTTGMVFSKDFEMPLAGVGPNTAIILTLPAVGTGSTRAAICLRGFKGERSL